MDLGTLLQLQTVRRRFQLGANIRTILPPLQAPREMLPFTTRTGSEISLIVGRRKMMGIASLHPSYGRGGASAPPRLDRIERGQCLFEFVVEEPHGVENFAKARRCPGPVGAAEGKNAVVAQ